MKQEHLIFKAAVEVYNQSDCDKLKDLCERYELPIWKEIEIGFEFMSDEEDQYLKYCKNDTDDYRVGFYIDTLNEDKDDDLAIMSMEEFESLAEDYNPQYKSIDDILSTLKKLNNILNNK
jgi:hypothetical protein